MHNVSWFEQRTTFALQMDFDGSEQCNVHFLYVIMEYDIYFGICLCSMLTYIGFLNERVKTVDFSESIAACGLKVGRCRQLIE